MTKLTKIRVVNKSTLRYLFLAGLGLGIAAGAAGVVGSFITLRGAALSKVPPIAFQIGQSLCGREDAGALTGILPPLRKTGNYVFYCENGNAVEDILIDYVPETKQEQVATATVVP